MAGDSSFDVVSDFDQQELVNALDQVGGRSPTATTSRARKVAFDLGKDASPSPPTTSTGLVAKDLLETKAVRRNLSLKIFDWGRLEPASGGTVRQEVKLKRGLTSDQAKELAKRIRESFPKTKPIIQGDAVRVSAKSKNELQAVIADLRALDYPVALQFTNYR